MKLYPKYWVYAGFIPLITILLDQWSKYAIIDMFDNMAKGGAFLNHVTEKGLILTEVPPNICEIEPEPRLFTEVSPIIDWALVCNQGVSFGLFSGDSAFKRWALTIFAAVMCCVLLYVLTRTKDMLSRLSLGLIIGGAIGNGIDRALYGAVTDFISVHELIPFFPWVFNIADSAITCGVIGLLIAGFWADYVEKKAKTQNS